MTDTMSFPQTIEEFMEQYKVVDTEQVYSNGVEFVPIFRVKQWLEHSEKHGRWLKTGQSFVFPEKFRNYFCSECGFELDKSIRTEYRYCPNCGAKMNEVDDDKEDT